MLTFFQVAIKMLDYLSFEIETIILTILQFLWAKVILSRSETGVVTELSFYKTYD